MIVSTHVDSLDWAGWRLRYPIWHAYHALSRTKGVSEEIGIRLSRGVQGTRSGTDESRISILSTDSTRCSPPLSQAKALLANLGNVLGYDKNSRTNWFDDKTDSDSISFNEFIDYFDKALLSRLLAHQGSITEEQIENVEDLCWLLTKSKYLDDKVNRPSRVLDDSDARRLWDIFNFLAEEEAKDEEEDDIDLFVDKEEVGFLIERIMLKIGKGFRLDEFEDLTEGTPAFSYFLLLNPLEIWYLHDQESSNVSEVVKAVWEEFRRDVLKKGSLNKRGMAVTGWRRRWLVLTPGLLRYYASPLEDELKGELKLLPSTTVKPISNARAGPFATPHAFTVEGVFRGKNAGTKNDKNIHDFSASGFREKNEWISAICSAIEDRRVGITGRARREFVKRRSKRKKELETQAETRELRETLAKWNEDARMSLEREKTKRMEDIREKEKAVQLHEGERKRREELQAVNSELETLLEEERNLRRDEELVRAAQARFIADELTAEADFAEAERNARREAQDELEKEMEISDSLYREKIKLERTLEMTRQELDDIEKSRDVAENKLRILMRRCGLDRLPSSREGSLGDNDPVVDIIHETLPSDSECLMKDRRTSAVHGNSFVPTSSFPAPDDDVFVDCGIDGNDGKDVVLSPVQVEEGSRISNVDDEGSPASSRKNEGSAYRFLYPVQGAVPSPQKRDEDGESSHHDGTVTSSSVEKSRRHLQQLPPPKAAAQQAAASVPNTCLDYEPSSRETPPALPKSVDLYRRGSLLKTGEINLKKKLIIRRNSSKVGKSTCNPKGN